VACRPVRRPAAGSLPSRSGERRLGPIDPQPLGRLAITHRRVTHLRHHHPVDHLGQLQVADVDVDGWCGRGQDARATRGVARQARCDGCRARPVRERRGGFLPRSLSLGSGRLIGSAEKPLASSAGPAWPKVQAALIEPGPRTRPGRQSRPPCGA
jgi:hypothetical protein